MMIEIGRPAITREQLERWLSDESGLLRGEPVPALQRLRQEVVAEGLALAAPASIHAVYAVTGVRHNRLLLDGGVIDDAWFADMMAPAHSLVLAVCTIGPALERRASAYTAAGDAARAYMLDAVGTGLVELTRCGLLLDIEAMAAAQGDEASVPLSPGDTQWPLPQQQRLFDLLPAGEIGVTLSPQFLMRPLKSVSLAVGLGPDMGAAAEGSACDYCDIRDRCQLRAAREKQGK